MTKIGETARKRKKSIAPKIAMSKF